MLKSILIIFGLLLIVVITLQAFTLRLEQKLPTLAEEKKADVTVSAFIGDHRFTLYGYTSPHAQVAFSGLGIYDETTANKTGYFEFKNRFSPFNPREACLTAKDQLGRLSAPVCLPPFPIVYDATIGPVIMPPTVSLNETATGGYYYVDDEIILSGQTIPNTAVDFSVYMDNKESRESIKSEIRNPKFETNSNSQNSRRLENSNLEIVSNFDIRASNFINRQFSIIKPVEAYSFPTLDTKSDAKGNFSISIPSASPQLFRLFARADYAQSLSPDSVRLSLQVYPIWMIIIHLFLLLFGLIKDRLLEFIILTEVLLMTVYLLRRYLHPHIVARNRALALRELYPIVKNDGADHTADVNYRY